MSKRLPKEIQKELKEGVIWPVYWLFGSENLKIRELVKRIRHALTGSESKRVLNEENLDGSEVEAQEIVDTANTLALGGGSRLILIRNAHQIKNTETLAKLLGPASTQRPESVCVFISKDLDGRKKFSKLLLQKAAVVSCEEVKDVDRNAWISYLAKLKGVELGEDQLLNLRIMEPWSLEIVDNELEKLFLLPDSQMASPESHLENHQTSPDLFIEAFFRKDPKKTREALERFSVRSQEGLPLLGLLAWYTRQFALFLNSERVKLSPYVRDRLRRWQSRWTFDEVCLLQKKLSKLDFQLKQSPRSTLGIWEELVVF